jgi:Fe2+ or Zn2+ uptake regulation protein
MDRNLAETLRQHGVRPSAQRMAVASYVLTTEEHPVAEQVMKRVRARFPMLSRATVYNTLNLFVEKGLLRQLTLDEGNVVYDPRVDAHHHFIDESSGRIHDVPWSAVKVEHVESVPDVEVREYMVVMRGKRLGGPGIEKRSEKSAPSRVKSR